MASPTGLRLPDSLPYPLHIVKHLVAVAPSPPTASTATSTSTTSRPWTVRRGTALFSYSVLVNADEAGKGKQPEIRTYESPIEGDLVAWRVQPGQEVRNSHQVVVDILESCSHPKQFHGMCAECGAELTGMKLQLEKRRRTDYLGFSDLARAPVRMSHDDAELTVSMEEANRLEKETSDRLRKDRKLSLIVDLDQTVIHATVDPTVGEWMRDESNPNFAALKGVSAFKLGPDGALAEDDAGGQDSCCYYVKLRPGLADFLDSVAQLYEMHVYTMGTRNYAAAVCQIIDPTNRLFGGRILSRDESGSLTQKSLNRLFPCDTSMVVIIDDRADVWEWCPNLLKVIPYDFFVGIGDINSAFLPKRPPLEIPPSPKGKEPPSALDGSGTASETAADTASSASSGANGEPDDEKAAARRQAAAMTQTQALADQVHDRPLLKKQEALHAVAIAESKTPSRHTTPTSTPPTDTDVEVPPTEAAPVPEVELAEEASNIAEGEEAVLKDDDKELDRVYQLLKRVHTEFYAASADTSDVKEIIPDIKRAVLDGVGVLFSGVIPLNVPQHRSEIWRLATQFGASCLDKLNNQVTHVVTAKPDTAKVNAARLRKDVTIVWASWLFDSIALWRRQSEADYAIDPAPNSLPHPGEVQPDPPDVTAPPSSHPPSPTPDPNDDGDALSNGGAVDLDWDDADRELEEMLNETDADSEAENGRSGGNSRKRSRSRSTSLEPEPPAKGSTTGSPLSKRQRMASNRRSRLKNAYEPEGQPLTPGPPSGGSKASAPSEAGSDDDDYEAMAAGLDAELG